MSAHSPLSRHKIHCLQGNCVPKTESYARNSVKPAFLLRGLLVLHICYTYIVCILMMVAEATETCRGIVIYRSFATTVSQLKICDFSRCTFKGFEVL